MIRKPRKFKSKDYRKIWFVSDLHLNQKSCVVLKGRGFSEMVAHDEYLKKYWHDNLTNEDLVINLGDSHFNDPAGELFEDFSKWPAKEQIYLWGNHRSGARRKYLDLVDKYPLGDVEIYPLKYNNITFVGFYYECFIDNIPLILNHFPLSVWTSSHHGFAHLTGHSHNSFIDTQYTNLQGKSLDCGIESAQQYSGGTRPFFEWNEIKMIMENKSVKIKDHHREGVN